jgi:uncharacterized membrane-anchored protein YhcB (DUF1043 family)
MDQSVTLLDWLQTLGLPVVLGFLLARYGQRKDAEQRRKEQIELADRELERNTRLERWRAKHEDYRQARQLIFAERARLLSMLEKGDLNVFRNADFTDFAFKLQTVLSYEELEKYWRDTNSSLFEFKEVARALDEFEFEPFKKQFAEVYARSNRLLQKLDQTIGEIPS